MWVYNENIVSPMKIWGFQQKSDDLQSNYWDLQRKSGVLQPKTTGVSNENLYYNDNDFFPDSFRF